MSKSIKQRAQCFLGNLPHFLKEQESYLANRKQGVRPLKSKKK